MSKQMKGIIVIVIVLSMLMGNLSVFAMDGDVIIKSFSVSKSSISPGESFLLSLTLDSNSGSTFSRVSLIFETGANFQVVGSGNVVPANTDLSQPNNITLMYTGGNDLNIPITISYEYTGGAGTTSTKLYIKEAKPETPPSQTAPTDTTKYKPRLELSAAAIPEGRAGGTIQVPFTLTNNSNFEAREMIITPVFNVNDNPFTIEQMTLNKTIDRLLGNRSVDVEFQFKIDRFAERKTYALPLKIEYKNAFGNSFSEEKIVYVNITNTNLPPQLVVRQASSNPAVVEGEESFRVTFDIWNMGTIEAENVTVDLKPNENFFVLDNVTKQFLFEMKGLQNKSVTYTLKPKKELKTGTYGITIALQHKGSTAPSEYTVYVPVKAEEEEEEEGKVNIITENIVTPKVAIQTEQPFTVSMNIRNTGTKKAENVKISVDSGDKILPQSLNVMVIPSIEPGESVPVAFSFMPGKDSENRSYPIKATIEYKDGDDSVRKEQFMGVLVESTKTTTLNTVPKIIISEYSTEPGIVNAGENFALRMSFLNTNRLRAVQNMKITLIVNEGSEQSGSVFTPVQSSNTFYIDYLEPGKVSEKEMVMYTIPDAKAKTYVVKAVFEYEYEEQGQLKVNNMEDVFGIPVVQPAKLETTDVFVSEPAFVGEPLFISCEFYNMGKVALSNLMVRVEGDFTARDANYFVGNFQMGYSDYYDTSIIPNQPGELTGMVVFTFEDAAGQPHRIEKPFTAFVMEAAPVMGFPGMIGDPWMDPGKGGDFSMGPQPSRFPIIPVAIGGGVVIAVVVLIIVLRKRKKRKELMLDEDI